MNNQVIRVGRTHIQKHVYLVSGFSVSQEVYQSVYEILVSEGVTELQRFAQELLERMGK
jgi:hypothetical protein